MKLKEFQFNRKCLLQIMVFMMIFISPETLMFGDTIDEQMISIAQCSNLFIIVIATIAAKTSRFRKKDFRLLIVLLIALWLSFFFNVSTEQCAHYVLKSLLIIGAFIISMDFACEEIWAEVERCIYFFTICGLVLHVAKIIVPNVVDNLPTLTSMAGVHYNTIYLSSIGQRMYLWSRLYRLQSIFREPGVFAIYLFFALWNELFFRTQLRTKRIIIYVISALLTLSTTAYICIFTLFLAFVFKKNNFEDTRARKITIIFFVTVVLYLLLFTSFLSQDGVLLSKFNPNKDTYISGIARLGSAYVDLYVLAYHPILGFGIYNLNKNFSNILMSLTGKFSGDNTNSVLMSLAAHGIFFGGIIILGWYRFACKHVRKIFERFFLIIAIFALLSCEYMLNNMLFYLVVFMGIKSEIPQNKKENKKD